MGTLIASSLHAMRKGATKCYFTFLMPAASAEMAILEERVCAGRLWEVLPSLHHTPSLPSPPAAPEGRCAPAAAEHLLCPQPYLDFLLLWRRKSQTCFGPKISKIMS